MIVLGALRASTGGRFARMLVALGPMLAAGCTHSSGPLPAPPPPAMQRLASLMNLGLAHLAVGQDRQAEAMFAEITRLAPAEPAGWADRGLARLRQGQGEPAAVDIDKAVSLSPPNAALEMLAALAQSARGNDAAALDHIRRAVKIAPNNLRARYALVQQLERARSAQGGPNPPNDVEVREQLNAILERQPMNLPVLLELARDAASSGDTARLREIADRIERAVPKWPPEARPHFDDLRRTLAAGNARAALTPVLILKNVLLPTPVYRQGLDAIRTPASAVGEPITRFLRLPNPPPTPSPPDIQLAFDGAPLTLPRLPAGPPERRWVRAARLWSRAHRPGRWEEGSPMLLLGSDRELVIAEPGKTAGAPAREIQRIPLPGGSAAGALLLLDWNNDFRMDLALAGPSGLSLYQQGADRQFHDITDKAVIPSPWRARAYNGLWAADVESDGDLDIIAGVRGGSTLLLRNNADGTFKLSQPWPAVRDVRDVAWADLDGDGDNDLVMLDTQNHVTVLDNERAGVFKPISGVGRRVSGVGPKTAPNTASDRSRPSDTRHPTPDTRTPPDTRHPTPDQSPFDHVAAMTVDDIDGDGRLDLILLDTSGAVQRAWRGEDGAWNTAPLVKMDVPPRGAWRLITGDFDNNGGLDLLAAGPQTSYLWLNDGSGGFLPSRAIPAGRVEPAEMDGNGRLDLVGINPAGAPVRLANHGSRPYHWLEVRPKAYVDPKSADQRNNSYGIGGEMELLAANLYQKRPMRGPVVHFGLGERADADVLRVVWPNGFPDIEFEPKANAVLTPEQRLKGSCPWLFANDGRTFRFVTDILWRSGLGIKINAQDGSAPVAMTLDRVRVRRDQLAAHRGFYELSITAELWETMYFDMVGLQCVDHPAGTEVALDERFSIPPPDQRLHMLRALRPVRRAVDDRGRDATELLRARDGRYLGGFPLSRYQGLATEHRLELTLGDWSPGAPVWLVAEGWTHPTDSSLNVALGQGRHPHLHGLRVEAADGRGGWIEISKDAGFPAGKTKTVLLDLTNRFPTADHRLRLTTDMEIYWDRIATAVEATDAPRRILDLRPSTADLRLRGYSAVHQAHPTTPELPDYNQVSRGPRWRDLIGFYTRPGDVRELLARVDDRYVIMNAGDEIALRFPAPPPPPPGWVRDFIFVSDGWEKDGDLNTVASKTVLPLPTHRRADYPPAPTHLEKDPTYRRHRADWLRFHTRYVDGRTFEGLLRALGE